MRIAFNPSTVEALIAPPNNKDITFDLRGQNIFARGVKFCGTDTNTWRDIKINSVSIGSNTLDLRDSSTTTLTNINGVVTINSTWRPVVDNLTSDSTTSSLSANQGRVLKALIDSKSDSDHNHDDRYLRLIGGWMSGDINFGGDNKIYWGRNSDSASISFKNDGDGDADSYMSFVTSDNGNEYFRWSHSSGSTNTEWMALRSDGLRVGGTKVSLEGHSHNDLYYTKTEVNNKLIGKSDTSHTHDDRYLKLTGGTISGTIYRNSGGATISGRDHAIIRQTYAPGGSSWNPIACVDTETGTWTLGHLSSGDSDTNFHFCFSTNTDYNAGNNNGNYVTLRNKVGTIALLSEIPDKNSWNYDDRYYTKAESDVKYITDITTSVNKLTFTRNGSNIDKDIKVNVVYSQGNSTNISDKNATTKANSGLFIYNSYGQTIGTNLFSSVLSINTGGTIQIAGNWGDDQSRNLYWRSQSDKNVADYPWKSWRTILDSENTYVSNNKGYINNTEITQVNNADTVDGYHANGLFRDLGWWNQNDTHDANAITGNGAVFAYADHANVPTCGVLVTFSGGQDYYRWQMAKAYASRNLYIRQRNGDNGTWSNWLRLLDESDLTWNNIAGKPSTFNPTAHTHTVFNNNLMIKGTNGISNDASIHLGIGDSDTGFKWISDGKCQIYANYVAVGEWTSRGMNWFKNPTVNGNKVWNEGNDGSGSGLDADTVDGCHASKFPYINNNGIWRIYGNAAVAALADNTAGLSSWAFGESRDYGITYLGILKPSTDTCGINAHGTIAVFGQGDTHLGIASDYGRANLQVFGGNADKIVWRKKVAFTSDIPTVTNYYWANIKVSASSSTSTSPTFESLWINNSHFFKQSGTTFTCQGGTTFTLPSSSLNTNTALLWTTASDGTRDTGIFYNSSNFAFIANSNDHGAVFAVYDTDVTQDFEAGAREISVPGSGGALWARGGFSKNGSSNDYVLLGGGDHKLESSLNVASASVASKVYGQVGDTGSHELVRCDMNNDQFRIIAGSNGNNNGWAEIATADDGSEPIYVRQYTGVFSSVRRTLTLLNESGNTIFPGSLSIGGQIIREGQSTTWAYGRGVALLRETSAPGYHTLWSLKTTDGSWDFGEYNTSGWHNVPVLSYITDSNYNSGNNVTTYQIKFPLASGTVALTSFGGDSRHPIFLGYLNLEHGNDGTVSSSFPCLGYKVPFTYTIGGNYCRIHIPDTSYQIFYIKAAIASVNYSGGEEDAWVGDDTGNGVQWLHCYAAGPNEVRIKGFCYRNSSNNGWWGGNPLQWDSSGVGRITVCIFGEVIII